MFHGLFHLGITLVIGFDYVEALDATWRMYNKSDELAKLMHRLFITDELLKRMRVKFIEIRTRMWEMSISSAEVKSLPVNLDELQYTRKVKIKSNINKKARWLHAELFFFLYCLICSAFWCICCSISKIQLILYHKPP